MSHRVRPLGKHCALFWFVSYYYCMDSARFCTMLLSGRTSRDLTLVQVAKLVNSTGPTVGRWEAGKHLPTREQVRVLDEKFGYRGELLRAWHYAKSGTTLPPWANDVGELEERSRRIELASPHIVPGLLQSPEYMAMTMRRNLFPPREIQDLVDLRTGRCEYLLDQGLNQITAIFPASAVLVLPHQVRQEQVKRLLELMDTGRVDVHLIPDEEMPLGLMGPLMMFHLREGGTIGASEHNRGVIVHDEFSEPARLQDQVKRALGRSMPPAQSQRLLESHQGE